MAGNLARGNDLKIGQSVTLKVITIAGILFLLLPLIILILFSFNESRTVSLWTGFSLKWYHTAFSDAGLWMAVRNSVLIAIISTFITTILGTMGAILLAKYNFRGKELFQNLLYVPVILPEIILGVSLLALFMLIGFPLGLLSVICAHIAFSFPFVTMIILAKVINLPPSLEEASLDLGANRRQTFVKVILPNISPGVISGALFAFTMSIDDFVVTFFTAGVGASTLPLKIYSLIKFGLTPSINAISTILIIFTILALTTANFLQKSEKVNKKIKLAIAGFFTLALGFAILAPFFTKSQEKLNIYNYSDYLSEDLISEFEKETGIDVSVDFYNDNEELLSKLKMGVTGYDLIVPSGYMVKIMINEGLLAPINFDSIPNHTFISSEFRKMPYDSTGQYYVPYAYGYSGIAYNSDFIKDSINSWSALWDPRYKGKITMIDEMNETFFVAYKILGYDFEKDTSRLNEARDLLIRQKPLLKKYESNNIEALMLSGDVWIAHTWNGQLSRLANMNPKFKAVVPKEGVLFWVDNLCIPASSANKKNAEKFLNFLLRPENTARNIRVINYAMPNDSAQKLLESSLRNNKIIFPETDESGFKVLEDKGAFNRKIDRAWTEVKIN
jgi:spermidine/putrescine transport system permease protein